MTDGRPRPTRALLRGAGLLALIALTCLGGCGRAILQPEGPVEYSERTILFDALVIMLGIVIPTMVAIVIFAWHFRASNTRATYRPDWSYSGRLELINWSIPILVVMFLGGIAWVASHTLDPAAPIKSENKPLEIDIVALDWKWLFIYPENGIATVNEMYVPVNVPLNMRITSATVLNVFFVPELGSMIYSMYGMRSRLNLMADRTGDFFGLSAMINGDGFPDMHFDVHAVTPEQFAEWATRTRGAGGATLDDRSYRELLVQTMNVKPYSYASVQPGLFDAIVLQKFPPGDGPKPKVPGLSAALPGSSAPSLASTSAR